VHPLLHLPFPQSQISNLKFEISVAVALALAVAFLFVGRRLASPARVTPAKNVAYLRRHNTIRHSPRSVGLAIAHDADKPHPYDRFGEEILPEAAPAFMRGRSALALRKNLPMINAL
jgi:hypothetical protein